MLLFLAVTREGTQAAPAGVQPLPYAPEPEDEPELGPELLAQLAQEMREASAPTRTLALYHSYQSHVCSKC